MDWSYELLNPAERLLWQRLSVFAGGCALDAAEAVCSDEGLERGRVVTALGSLAAKSLVIADRRQGDEARYRLLEMVRQYGAEKLAAAGDTVRVRQRQRDYYLPARETTGLPPDPRPHFQWPKDLAAEIDNLRLAVDWSFSDPTDIEAGPRLVMAINNRWPPHQEYVDWYVRAVAFCSGQPDLPAGLHANLLGQAAMAMTLNDPQMALVWGRQAVAMSRRLLPEGKQDLMWHLYVLGNHYLEALRDAEQAVGPISEAETIFLELWPDEASQASERWMMGFRTFLNAHIAKQQGRYRQAIALASESVRHYEASAAPFETIRPRICLGEAYLGLGEIDQARAHFLAAWHLRDNPSTYSAKLECAYALRWVGVADFRLGHLAEALTTCHASLRLAAEVPDRNIIASGLGLAALIEASQGQSLRAATLSGASAALWQKQGRRPWDDCSLEACLPGWLARPDQAALASAFEQGGRLDFEQAVAYALGEPAE